MCSVAQGHQGTVQLSGKAQVYRSDCLGLILVDAGNFSAENLVFELPCK